MVLLAENELLSCSSLHGQAENESLKELLISAREHARESSAKAADVADHQSPKRSAARHEARTHAAARLSHGLNR